MAFFGYPHAPRATAQGIHFRSTAIVQSVSGDARDVPLTTEFLGWSYGLGARERQSCPFFGNDARFTGLDQAARRSIYRLVVVYKRQLIWPNSIDCCDSKNARHKRNVASSCRKSGNDVWKRSKAGLLRIKISCSRRISLACTQ